MSGKIKQPIDPRTTRHYVAPHVYLRSPGLYEQYRKVGTSGGQIVLEKKPEFCVRH